jgi:hypothetical protein
MRLVEYTYESEHGIEAIVLLQTGEATGFEAWRSATNDGTWVIDQQPTRIIHPIVSVETVGYIVKVVLA